MQSTIIILICISILLFILSIYQQDRGKVVEKQLENFSIQLMQEMYQLKEKVNVLEHEIQVTSTTSINNPQMVEKQNFTREDVLSMYENGKSTKDISAITSYSEAEVEKLLAN